MQDKTSVCPKDSHEGNDVTQRSMLSYMLSTGLVKNAVCTLGGVGADCRDQRRAFGTFIFDESIKGGTTQ